MSVELLQTLSVVAYIIAGVLLLVAIALFFLLNIPKLYGDLTGKNARKAIESIRQQNEGAITAKTAKGSKKSSASSASPTTGSFKTEKFSTTKLMESQETTILAQSSSETTVLSQPTSETTVLSATASAETTILSQQQPFGETAQLSNAAPVAAPVNNTAGAFNVVEELGFTSSSEIIQ